MCIVLLKGKTACVTAAKATVPMENKKKLKKNPNQSVNQ